MMVTTQRDSTTLLSSALYPQTNSDEFIAAMGMAATGVTVVATSGHGAGVAQTVSAMCSVSAEPPTLLACVHARSPLCAAVVTNEYFSVNVLSTDQSDVADTFAGRPRHGQPYDFACASWTEHLTGAPILRDAVATFDCRLTQSIRAGSHWIFVGQVLSSVTSPGDALVYRLRSYGRHEPLRATPHS